MFQTPKVLVIGLDCAEPSLLFGAFRSSCPNLGQLMDWGTYGDLESCIPCITIPAWMSMMTSRDPGQLGVYGFHNRPDHSYAPMRRADASAITTPAVWDHLSAADRKVILVGVPPSYPPRPVNGLRVGCFLTPSTDVPYTYPVGLSDEIRRTVGRYHVDVPHFRTDDAEHLLAQLYEMTDARFRLIRHLIREHPWSFFMFVEIGVDRIHHAMWRHHDSGHPAHEPGTPYAGAIRDYYGYVDARIGEVLELVDDDTTVFVVSDHGAKTMKGGIAINEWLVREKLLALTAPQPGLASLEACRPDWTRTVAWGAGGYYGRVFLNVEGREPNGLVKPEQYEAVRADLAARLEALPGPDGAPLRTVVYRPEQIYRECRGVAPDLIVYFDDLAWRSVGTLGHGGVHTAGNDTGADGANHARYGLFIHYDPHRRGCGRVDPRPLTDIGPAVMHTMGLPADPRMVGTVPAWMAGGLT
jgi:predicted AlkP superfamily phosphohydrolase/phosphomutase